MGTPAFANVEILFRGEFDLKNIVDDFNEWLKKVSTQAKLGEEHPSDLPYGDYGIGEISRQMDDCIYFKVYSSRIQNCEWQTENIFKYFESKKYKMIFQYTIYEEADSFYYDSDDHLKE